MFIVDSVKRTQKKVVEFIKRGSVRGGASCMFFRINDREGLKMYYSKRAAENACRKQRRAYRAGIAPRVLSRVRKCYNMSDDGCKCYAYKTQIALKTGYIRSAEFYTLERKMKKLNFSTCDMGSRNCGRVDGKLVFIDFCGLST